MQALHGPYRIHILNADDSPRFAPWSKPGRQLTWYLLVVSLTGSEEIQVGGESWTVEPGMSYLVPPGVRCSLGSTLGNQPVWVHFEVCWDEHGGHHPDAVPYAEDWESRKVHAQPSSREVWGVDLPVMIPDELTPMFRDALPRIVRRWKEGSPLQLMRSQHELAGIMLAWVAHVIPPQKPEPRHADLAGRFLAAERLAREQLGGFFGVTEFAAAAGFSRSRFSVLYREHTGVSPGEYLRGLRLARAKTLLKDTGLPVLEVGALVGYHDPSVFGRLFRKHSGMTPAEWREENRR